MRKTSVSSHKLAILVAVAVLLVAGVVVYSAFDPGSARWFPKCPFLMLTGYQCPGCGSQRAIHALLHGDVAGAWHFNALLVAAIPFLLVYGAVWLVRWRHPRWWNAMNSLWVIWGVFVVIVLWWIFRN